MNIASQEGYYFPDATAFGFLLVFAICVLFFMILGQLLSRRAKIDCDHR
jgi:hypothetical protein